MRNPWGVTTYHGDWSYYSSLWTDDLRQYVEKNGPELDTNLHEGIFYIDLESFRQNFDEFNVNYDTSSWFLDYFLKLDDTTEETWDSLFCSGCIVNRL